METIKELIESSAKKYSDNICIFENKEKYYTYQEFYTRIKYLRTYLLNNGFKNKKIGIVGRNSYHWCLIFFAICSGAGVAVPLDKELTKTEIENCIKKAEIDYIFYDDEKKMQDLRVKSIHMDEIDRYIKEREKIYDNVDYDTVELKKDDLAVLLFTSGTSSSSKVVMLSQNNIVFTAKAFILELPKSQSDRYFSILPISHSFELVGGFIISILGGSSICFSTGLKNIKEELLTYKPTIINCVPRVLDFFATSIKNYIKSEHLDKKIKFRLKLCNFFDKFKINVRQIVFRKIYEQFGGRLRMLTCGGAKLDENIFDYLDLFGFYICQGYGLTETSPILTLVGANSDNKKSVGKPLLNTEIKIVNKDKNGIGRIIVKGPQVMLGYYKQPIETKEVLNDGWFNTGDLGYFDNSGCLNIIGRDKNVIIANNGKNVYPEEIEELLNSYDIIKESLVKGIEINKNTIILAQLVLNYNEKDSKQKIKDVIKDVNKKLAPYKHIGKFEIMDKEFVKTATLKIKR